MTRDEIIEKASTYRLEDASGVYNFGEIIQELSTAIEQAYGLLWRDTSPRQGSPSSEARKLLLEKLDKEGQRRGIGFAHERFGPVSDHEALKNFP